MRLSMIATLAFSLAISAQAHASVEQQLASCATQSDKLDRLMCYDALAESVATLTTITPVVVPAKAATVATAATVETVAIQQVSSTQIAKKTEENFGLKKKAEADGVRLYADVSAIKKDHYGALIVTLSNNQTWKQVGTDRYKLKSGQTVFIEQGALGSYLLGSDSRNSTMRVKRLN